MGDADNVLPPSKKRAAGRQLSRDNPDLDDEEETSEQETGTFKRASCEVMASRRIVKARHHQTSSTPSVPLSNPFAGICFVPLTNSTATPVEVVEEVVKETVVKEVEEKNGVNQGSEKEEDQNGNQDGSGAESAVDDEKVGPVNEPVSSESAADNEKVGPVNEPTSSGSSNMTSTEDKAEIEAKDTRERDNKESKNDHGDGNVAKSAEPAPFSSFGQLSSSQNAFSGLAGATFPSSTFSFGPISKDSGSVFEEKSDRPSFSFGLSNNGNSSLFGTPAVPVVNKTEASEFPSMQEVPVETGEENEKAVLTADSVLFEFLDGCWKERGKGELKVNVPKTGTGKARLVMRAKGNYRLILNASLYPDMKLTNMEKRGITFACVNSTREGKDGLSTFALKFKDTSFVEEFRAAVTEHRGNTAVAVKTPENSSKASDD